MLRGRSTPVGPNCSLTHADQLRRPNLRRLRLSCGVLASIFFLENSLKSDRKNFLFYVGKVWCVSLGNKTITEAEPVMESFDVCSFGTNSLRNSSQRKSLKPASKRFSSSEAHGFRPCLSIFSARTISRTICLVACVVGTISLAVAQGPNINSITASTATPKPGDGHDYIHLLTETVSPASGNLSIRFQFPIPSGRGIAPPYEWQYDSSTLYHLTTVGNALIGGGNSGDLNFQQTLDTANAVGLGWRENEPTAKWSESLWTPPIVAALETAWMGYPGPVQVVNTTFLCSFATNFTFSGYDGAAHGLALGAITTNYTSIPGISTTGEVCGAGGIIPAGGDTAVAAYLANPGSSGSVTFPCSTTTTICQMEGWQSPNSNSGSLSMIASGNLGPFVVYDEAGTRYTFWGGGSQDSDFVMESEAGSGLITVANNVKYPAIEDRNGNIFDFYGLDTVGRTPLFPLNSESAMTVGGITYTISSTTGAASNYTIPFSGTINPEGSSGLEIGCPPVLSQANFGTAATNYIATGGGSRSIEIPSTPSTMYTTYWGTSTNPSTGQVYSNPYNLINEVDYPSGGWVKYNWQPGSSTDFSQMAKYAGTIFLPSGAGKTYTGQQMAGACVYWYSMPTIHQRFVSFDGQTIAQTQTYSYTTTWPNANTNPYGDWVSKSTTVVTQDNTTSPSGDASSKYTTTVYTYIPMPIPIAPMTTGATEAQIPVEQKVQYYNGNGTTNLFRTVTQSWYNSKVKASETVTLENGASSTTTYCYVNAVETSGSCPTDAAMINGQVSIAEDSYRASLLLEKREFDYGNNPLSGGTPTRRTVYTYQPFPNPTPNPLGPGYPMPDLMAPKVATEKVYNSLGTLVAETDYTYDDYTTDLAGHGLTSISGIEQHDDANYGASMKERGNLTTVRKRCLATGVTGCSQDAITTYAYDTTGQITSTTDPNGNTTHYAYGDSYYGTTSNTEPTNAYVTKITNAKSQTTSYEYVYVSGELYQATDENGSVSNYGYDNLFRLTEAQGPVDPFNASARPTSQTTYDDSPVSATTPSVTVSELLTNTPSPTYKTTTKITDGVGHVLHTQGNDPTGPGGTVYVDTTYDGFGRATTVTNPYWLGTPTATDGTTTFSYDIFGRKTIQKQPDGKLQLWCYQGIASTSQSNCHSPQGSVSGSWVDFQDELGNDWQRVSDSLGRLTSVVEPSATSTTPSMETDYFYDALNNLTKVNQYGAGSSPISRTFSYDSLSQLQLSTNPETGTVSYSYYPNGNLYAKVDARGITAQYAYDSLNRVLSKSFFNDPSGTPSSCYQYDLATSGRYGIGRLANAWTQSSTTACQTTAPTSGYWTLRSVSAYDPPGHVMAEQQFGPLSASSQMNFSSGTSSPPCQTGSITGIAYCYDLAGDLTFSSNGVKSPAYFGGSTSITFTNTYDAAARLSTSVGNLGAVVSKWSSTSNPVTLFSAVPGSTVPCANSTAPPYAPFGGLMNATFGSGLTLNRAYDIRLRTTCEIDTGAGVSGSTSGTATVTVTGSEQSN